MNSELDEGCVSPCMVQVIQVSFGYPGRLVADQVSHRWHAGLCDFLHSPGGGRSGFA